MRAKQDSRVPSLSEFPLRIDVLIERGNSHGNNSASPRRRSLPHSVLGTRVLVAMASTEKDDGLTRITELYIFGQLSG